MQKYQIQSKIILITIVIILLLVAFINPHTNYSSVQAIEPEPLYEQIDRFGITAPLGVVGYDLSEIHATSYLDWGKESSSVPEGVEYIHVLKMRFVPVAKDNSTGDSDEAAYQSFILDLPDLISRNPESVWIIGNEPDRKAMQDDLTPEKYAERFYEVAKIIRNTDSTAKIGFGSIVQPTPIRIRYLQRSLERLHSIAEENENPMDLIDIWTIHNFILNEEYIRDDLDYWGAEIPPGFSCPEDCYDAFIVNDFNYSVTYSIEIFSERINNFRDWLKTIGEQNKPLWITEYGSLFPDWEVETCYEDQDNCSPRYPPYEEWPLGSDNIQFMIDTFNFLLYASDFGTGLPIDEYKLVQRWYWYSLNGYVKRYPLSLTDPKYSYGGSLYDPDNNRQITKQGIAYKQYIEFLINPKIYLPLIFR